VLAHFRNSKGNRTAIFFAVCLLVRCPKPHRQSRISKAHVLYKDKYRTVILLPNRERNVRLQLLVTEEEAALIREKMLQVGTTNFSMYARKMLIDGYVIKRDFTEIKALTKELANLARSINQIALRANETRNIYEQDLKDLQHYYYNVKRAVSEQLVKIIRE
jgi:hypothetical protein